MKLNVAAAALASVAFLGCSTGTQIAIVNQSDSSLEHVLVSGSGFSQQVGTIAPHSEARVVVHPTGESGLQIRFEADGRSVSSGPEGYFEAGGGYRVTAVISPKLEVTVKSDTLY